MCSDNQKIVKAFLTTEETFVGKKQNFINYNKMDFNSYINKSFS